jgi:UDP-GlcNAc:undecaprenyl-phosphate GlcNAc-1-phosphate transferase
MDLISQNAWLVLSFAVLLSVVLASLLIPVARRAGWVDHPGLRKLHLDATPLVGGCSVYLAIVATVAISPLPAMDTQSFVWILLGGSLVLLLTGLVDDVRGLSPTVRFCMQILASALVIRLSGLQLADFGQLFGSSTVHLGIFSMPITVFAAMGVINSFNLIDGMDGLSGSVFLIAAAGMGAFAWAANDFIALWLLAIAMAAVLGFLLLNARLPWNEKARLFLGDAGSLMLGFILAWCFIRLGSGDHRAFSPMTAVWLFAIPLLDTSTLMWLRWREGKSPFAADQKHLHHAFLRAGYSVAQTWLAITALAVLFAGVGVVLEISGAPEYFSFYTFMVFALTYYFYVKHSWAAQRFAGRHFIHHDFEIDESISRQPGGKSK